MHGLSEGDGGCRRGGVGSGRRERPRRGLRQGGLRSEEDDKRRKKCGDAHRDVFERLETECVLY